MTDGLQSAKLAEAIARREPLRRGGTDALRIVDGRGDGFDDLEIDDFAGHWLVQTRGELFPPWLVEATETKSMHWKKLGDKTAPQWICGGPLDAPFVVRENGVRYGIDFRAGYSQGLFLDQRDNRRRLRESADGKTVLNCFAYTCAFGVAAALGGAESVNLDLSQRYLDWGRRNYALNDVPLASHEFIYGDVGNWLRRFARKSRRFDLIILDPPTFSRDDRGAVFTMEDGFARLVQLAEKIINPGGALFCSTNQRSLWPETFRSLIFDGLAVPARWRCEAVPMPADFCGEPYLKSCWLQSV